MSFLDRARQAAEQARQAAAERAHQAQVKIHEQAPIIQAQTREGLGIAGANIKVGAKQAKKGVITLVDKIDPGILADIIIKATALQEKANNSLRAKGSPYRIDEITITAAIPPQLGFSIARIGDIEEELTGREIASADLAATIVTEEFSLVPTDADGQPLESDIVVATATEAQGVAIGAGEAVVGWTAPAGPGGDGQTPAPSSAAPAATAEGGGTAASAPGGGTDESAPGGGTPNA